MAAAYSVVIDSMKEMWATIQINHKRTSIKEVWDWSCTKEKCYANQQLQDNCKCLISFFLSFPEFYRQNIYFLSLSSYELYHFPSRSGTKY